MTQVKKASFMCPKCFEYHQNIEVHELKSYLKDYTHFAECPNKNNQVTFVSLKKEK